MVKIITVVQMGQFTASVVIPTCHRLDMLAQCLERLSPQHQAMPYDHYEVIVTDDGVQPTAESLLFSRFPWARWIKGPRQGPAANRNNGAAQARGAWLIFTDDDCLPCDGYVAHYLAAIQANNRLVLEGRTVATGVCTRHDMECPKNETGGYLWSCNFCIQRELFTAMGGFDERFSGPFMEDVDLRTRLLKAGQQFIFVPNAEVGHGWRRRRGFKYVRLKAHSIFYYLSKHPEEWRNFRGWKRGRALLGRAYRKMNTVIKTKRFQGLGRFFALEIYEYLYLTIGLFRASKSGSSGFVEGKIEAKCSSRH